MEIVDLTDKYQENYFVCLEDWSDEIKEAGNHKEMWYNQMKDKGLRVKLAIDDDKVCGMIQYSPAEHSFVEGSKALTLKKINNLRSYPIEAGVIKASLVGCQECRFRKQEMKKITSSTYKKDKYYKKITGAVHELLKEGTVVAPVDVFIKIGNLTKENYEDWRFGRIPYLERVILCNLSKVNRILRILHYHALDRGLKPTQTVYKKWGKGRKILLRFSKSGSPYLESAYSRHYIGGSKAKFDKQGKGAPIEQQEKP